MTAFDREETAELTTTRERVVDHVRRLIEKGDLRPGDRLPGERDLAVELGLSRPSVRSGLEALEAMGVVVSRRGAGTFIAARKPVVKGEERRRRFREAIEAALADAFHLGLSEEEARKAFDAAMKRFRLVEER